MNTHRLNTSKLADVLSLQLFLWLCNKNYEEPEYDPGPIDGIYGKRTDAAFNKLLKKSGWIKRDEIAFWYKGVFPNCCFPNEDGVQVISTGGYSLIHSFEVGTPFDYEKIYSRPSYPGGDSGVTIGFGYDLGYEPLDPWVNILDSTQLTALKKCVGLKGSDANKALRKLLHIKIGYMQAEKVFSQYTLPKWRKLTLQTFDCAELPIDCISALISLCYNRGTSLKGPKRKEMAEIAIALKQKRYNDVPQLIEAQSRLWENTSLSGLVKRRKYEARLFAEGLNDA